MEQLPLIPLVFLLSVSIKVLLCYVETKIAADNSSTVNLPIVLLINKLCSITSTVRNVQYNLFLETKVRVVFSGYQLQIPDIQATKLLRQ